MASLNLGSKLALIVTALYIMHTDFKYSYNWTKILIPTMNIANATSQNCLAPAPAGTLCICADAAAQSNSSCVSQSDVLHYRLYEANEASGVMCRMVQIFTGDIGRVIAAFIMLTTGISTYFGKFTIATVLTMTVGMAIFFSATSILALISPGLDVMAGCGCKASIIIGPDGKGGFIRADLGLNQNCSERIIITPSS